MTHWLVGYLSALVARATKRPPKIRVQLLINPRNMMHMVMYDHVRPLPDVRYDLTYRATTTGNTLPVVAFPSRNCHTVVITGCAQCPKGPGYRSTGFSSRTGLGLAVTVTYRAHLPKKMIIFKVSKRIIYYIPLTVDIYF